MNTLPSRPVQNLVIAIFLITAFLFTIQGGYGHYTAHDGWVVGDWLINYQGGFVRRGFLGEIVYNVSYISGYNPGVIVFLLQISIYLLFLTFSYLILVQQKSLKAHLLLIFSSFIFYFQVFDIDGGYRKEIIYMAIISYVVWATNRYEERKVKNIIYVTLLFYPLVILTHEMLAIFLPYIVILYLIKIPLNKKRMLSLMVLLSISMAALVLSILNSGDQYIVEAIFGSLESAGYKMGRGAISWLAKDANDGFDLVRIGLNEKNYIKIYLMTMAIAFLSFIPILYKIIKIARINKIIFLLFLVSVAGSIGISMVAWDWGRLIYIHLISVFLISLVILQDEKEMAPFASNYTIIILSIINFSFWHIPHCCDRQPVMQDVNSTNIEVLLRRVF